MPGSFSDGKSIADHTHSPHLHSPPNLNIPSDKTADLFVGLLLPELLDSRTLSQQRISSVGEHLELSCFHAHEPVTEASSNRCIDRVNPEGFLVKEGTHFNAELP